MVDLNGLIVTRMTFGSCKVCKVNPAVYSSKVCEECFKKKNLVVRKLYEKNLSPGTEEWINELKKANVYY